MKTSVPVVPRILLIGNIDRAFSDVNAADNLPCEVRTNVLDAIEAADRGFGIIAVIISGSSGKLQSSLKALRQANSEARIVLLAQMYEEPLAKELAGRGSDGPGVADSYLICPIETRRFYESVTLPRTGRKVEAGAVVAADARTLKRIRQLEKLATEDDLTGLKNRRYIWEFAKQIIEHARQDGRQVTLLLFDVDNLKSYNDVYGHLAGDEVLKQAAVLMRRCCRQHDVIGRIGGDEFAAVFWNDPHTKAVKEDAERRLATAGHPQEAIFIAERFRNELENAELHLLGPTGKGILTISGGLSSFPRDGSTIEELFQQADKALMEAKRGGKNKIYLVGKPDSDIADIR
jgi:GGDEF domain-containing protein